MEETAHSPEVYDFRQYDRIWQRVAPTLEPYPTPNSAASTAVPAVSASSLDAAPNMPAVQPQQDSHLPGAAPDPCCMGSAAAEMLEVLTGFIEEELTDRRYLLALSKQAPAWARQQLREIAAEDAGHARRLMAVHYLITGECYRPSISCDRLRISHWCSALRTQYHNEACGGLNYARAAEGTIDPCLRKLLNELSADEYRHAESLLRLLERSLHA